MPTLERQIRAAQWRLFWNRWFGELCQCLWVAAGLLAVAVLVQRLWNLSIPLISVAGGLGTCAMAASIVRTIARRDGALTAAAALDSAAGLRERLSSGCLCQSDPDPFAQAVVADAERVSEALSVRQHLPFTTPRHLGSFAVTAAVAALCLLLPAGWLASETRANAAADAVRTEQAQADVRRSAAVVRKIAESTPALDALEEDAAELDKHAGAPLQHDEMRHDAAKKIDNLADAVKERRESSRYQEADETRKTLRGIKSPENAETPAQRLAAALSQGDVKTAKEEIEAVKEQLATLKADSDKEAVDRLSKQLEELAKQIEKSAAEPKVEEALKQAGLDKEDVERMLQSLDKLDLDQIKKALEKMGLDPQKAAQLAKQLQQKQSATSAAKQLAQKLKNAASGARQGQTGDAMESLTLAQDQLSGLEQAQVEAAQLDAALAELQNERGKLGQKPCSNCQGTGRSGHSPCPDCKGSGSLGGPGRGSGGRAPAEQTAVGFKTERQKIHTGKGAVIGQTLVDGDQFKGEVSSALVEVVSAGEREASDRMNRDRVPRQYQPAIKAYFTNVQDSLKKLRDDASTPTPREKAAPSPVDNAAQD